MTARCYLQAVEGCSRLRSRPARLARAWVGVASVAALFLALTSAVMPVTVGASTGKTVARSFHARLLPREPDVSHWAISRIGGTPELTLNSVASLSTSDAWAVGQSLEGRRNVIPPVLHWDGTGWRSVELPPFRGYALVDVEAPSRTDVWIVGVSYGADPRVLVACLSEGA